MHAPDCHVPLVHRLHGVEEYRDRGGQVGVHLEAEGEAPARRLHGDEADGLLAEVYVVPYGVGVLHLGRRWPSLRCTGGSGGAPARQPHRADLELLRSELAGHEHGMHLLGCHEPLLVARGVLRDPDARVVRVWPAARALGIAHRPPLLTVLLMSDTPPFSALREAVLNPDAPLAKRMRSVFYLRTLGTEDAVDVLCKGAAAGGAATPTSLTLAAAALRDRRNSALMRHELAYVLGQIGSERAIPTLTAMLEAEEDDVMVRHEVRAAGAQGGACGQARTRTAHLMGQSAEAMGAIGAAGCLEVLERYSGAGPVEVTETCQLAVERIRWLQAKKAGAVRRSSSCRSSGGARCLTPPSQVSEPEDDHGTPFLSVDPAPSLGQQSVPELRTTLLDVSQPLFKRYRAMFALRNAMTEEAALALAEGLFDPSSALFRHEIAYVLGQMEHPAATDALAKVGDLGGDLQLRRLTPPPTQPIKQVLRDEGEHCMVRHEAAEALGAIGTERATDVLRAFAADHSQVVRESCEVALDAADYWSGSVGDAVATAAS